VFSPAGALSFNLASPESAHNRPVFARLMLDEAFSKLDPQFARQALQAFRKFGFQLVIVATVQNATTIISRSAGSSSIRRARSSRAICGARPRIASLLPRSPGSLSSLA
jgi:uncharacterized protein YPO0396